MLEKKGEKSFLVRLAKAIRRRLPRTRTFVVFAGPPDGKYAGAMAAMGAEMVEITPENVDQVLSFRIPDVVNILRRHLEDGCKGWFAVKDDTIIGYTFLAVGGEKPRLVRKVLLHPGEVGAILVFTRPEFRGLGIGPAFAREIIARAADIDGVNSVVMWTVPSNQRWIRPLRRYGMKPAGKVWILYFWGRSVFRRTTGSPVKR